MEGSAADHLPSTPMQGTTNGSVKAVVFDVGGVLLDWNPEYLYRRLIPDEAERRRFLTEVCNPEWNLGQDAGRAWAEAVAELTARFPEQAELIAAYDQRWEDMVAGPIDESVQILHELRTGGVPVYALTNFSAEKWSIAVRRWPFLGEFDGRVVSAEEGITKPDPRLYRVLLERFRLDAATTLYVDDQPANVEQARALGLMGELFVDAERLRRRLRAHGLLDGKQEGR